MKYGSVCSGIEAASTAWKPLGWEAAFFSEIESFPSAVLAERHPETPNLGDMTKFQNWPDYAIDLLVGGTPCQSFSVAGLRKGLADPRGNLMLTYLAIAARYRPAWLVWENVPGVLSSNGGKDFGALLGGMGELGYGFAYRVLDAQYVRVESHPRAVPQRRRRVFVVGHLGDWRRAAAVLFERESLCGNPAPRREARQRPAPTLAARTRGGGGLGTDFDLDGGLTAVQCGEIVPQAMSSKWSKGSSGPAGDEVRDLVAHTARNSGAGFWSDDGAGATLGTEARAIHEGTLVAHSLTGEGFDASEDGSGRGTPVIPVTAFAHQQGGSIDLHMAEDVALAIQRNQGQAIAFSCKDHGADAGEIAPTLRSMGHSDSHANGGGQIAVACFDERQVTSKANRAQCLPDAAGTQHSTPHAIAIQDGRSLSKSQNGCGVNDDGAGYTIDTTGAQAVMTLAIRMAVRRLTPIECARLQGFPDDYLDITIRGKPAADGPKYRALGNSMAVNCMAWIGQRIAEVSKIPNK